MDARGGMTWVFSYKIGIFSIENSSNLISQEALFLVQNTPKPVWRPGSARTRWGSLQRSPDPLDGFGEGRGKKGGGRSRKKGGDRKEGGEREGGGGRKIFWTP